MAYLSIEQLGAIEGKRERERRDYRTSRFGERLELGAERSGGQEGGREEYLGYRVATCLQSEVEIRLRRIAHLHEQNHVHEGAYDPRLHFRCLRELRPRESSSF